MRAIGISLLVLLLGISSVCYGFGVGFIENVGQVDGVVRYYAHGSGVSVYFTDRGLVLDIRERVGGNVDPGDLGVRDREPDGGFGERVRGCAVYIHFEGCSEDVEVVGRGELGTRYNYFIGSDPSGWRTGVRAYSEVVYRGVWEGVDLVYRMDGGNLEYEVIGEDLGLVRFRYEGVERVVEEEGIVELETVVGALIHEQERQRGVLRVVGEVGEATGTLTDPPNRPALLLWSTFLGGSERDTSYAVVLDALGNPVVTGCTRCSNFPTTPGAYDTTLSGTDDVFVTKLSASGDSLIWSTYLGGSYLDWGYSIVLDAHGNPVVTGETWSSDFPTTPGAYDTTHNGSSDVFVVKLSCSGDRLLWSTCLGAAHVECGRSIVLDTSGNPVVTGSTYSINFPTTPNAHDRTHNGSWDVFVAKLSCSGDSLLWSTYLGGVSEDYGHSLVVDASGNPVVTGVTRSIDFPTTLGCYDGTFGGYSDVFVTKLSCSGDHLVWSTFIGGSGWDEGYSLVLDAHGNPVITGRTSSSDFPTTLRAYDRRHNGGADVFVTKLSSLGDYLLWSTFLGGAGDEYGCSIVLDPLGYPLVAGWTMSTNFPRTYDAYDRTHNGMKDAFVSRFSKSGQELLWSTYLGGSGDEGGMSIVLDGSGNPVLAGSTWSSDFPKSPRAYDLTHNGAADVFVAKLSRLQSDEIQAPEGGPGYYEDPGEHTVDALPDGWQPASQGKLFYISFPNPFTAGTRVYFSVSQGEQVSIKIYDVKGELVRVLVDGRYDAGTHEVIWDGRGDNGAEVASGIYFIRMEAGGRRQTQRIVVLR